MYFWTSSGTGVSWTQIPHVLEGRSRTWLVIKTKLIPIIPSLKYKDFRLSLLVFIKKKQRYYDWTSQLEAHSCLRAKLNWQNLKWKGYSSPFPTDCHNNLTLLLPHIKPTLQMLPQWLQTYKLSSVLMNIIESKHHHMQSHIPKDHHQNSLSSLMSVECKMLL